MIGHGLDAPEKLVAVGEDVPAQQGLKIETGELRADPESVHFSQEETLRFEEVDDLAEELDQELFPVDTLDVHEMADPGLDLRPIPYQRGRGQGGVPEGLLERPAEGLELAVGRVGQDLVSFHHSGGHPQV